jgi:hypothetical protein
MLALCIARAVVAQQCDDGLQCTTGDTCELGVCKGQTVACPDDGNPCTIEQCDPDSGNCVTTARDCDDLDPCTTDSCNPSSGCVYADAPEGTDCTSPADACVAEAKCAAGECRRTPKPEGSPCLPELPCEHKCASFGGQSFCIPTGTDDGEPCTDIFSKCTTGDQCQSGSCIGEFITCDDSDPCTIDSCDPEEGCRSLSRQLSCNDGQLCTTDRCDSQLGCVHEERPDGAGCDDGKECTTTDECRNGICVGLAPGLSTPTVTPTSPEPCAGDCNRDRLVTIAELITGVRIELGQQLLDQCPTLDARADGTVEIDELVRAVANALNGCGAGTPSATRRPTRTPGRPA